MLVDANARVGSLVSTAVDSHQASPENFHGELMHQWLVNHGMFAPQTMAQYHDGGAATFAHARGHEGRIDYVLLDDSLHHPSLRSFVMDIDLATQRPDQIAVAADVPFTFWSQRRCWRALGFQRASASIVLAPPAVDWSVDVHSHAALIHSFMLPPVPSASSHPSSS